MSDILARLRVTETHGIRRFLYPLTAEVILPRSLNYAALGIATRDNDIDMDRLGLVSAEGVSVPVQVTHLVGERFQVDFAVSLAPGASQEYYLMPGTPTIVDDRLHVTLRHENKQDGKDTLLESRQQRFQTVLNSGASLHQVVYEGVPFLRDGLRVTRDGKVADHNQGTYSTSPNSVSLNAWAHTSLSYEDGAVCKQDTAITACKSWVTVTHRQRKAASNAEIVFTLPLAVTSPTLTCDFGVGGYVFGKLQAGTADEVVWQTHFTEADTASWTVATAGRVDYIGEAAATDFPSQRWFHLIDSDKALAVAITDVPPECAQMTVTLRANGDVIVTFRMGDVPPDTAVKLGVCYHFLNDVPAIAAATNPQSILLPPTVEVLAA